MLALDSRPQCQSLGPVVDNNGNVPCQLHKGHPGLHEWDGYDPWRCRRWRKDRKVAGA